MLPVNVLWPEEIDTYLLKQADGNERLGECLIVALKKALLKDKRFLKRITTYPVPAPAWLTHEKFSQNAFHRFIPSMDESLEGRIRHIADWIGGAMASNDAWLKDVDAQGRPRKLLKIGSLEQATNMADKDMRRKANRLRSQFANAADSFDEDERFEHIGIAKEFENGCKIVRLLSAHALDKESAFLGHCIGNGNYDRRLNEKGHFYYSLRDPHNRAHATFEVVGGVLTQLKGKGNKPPVRKYMVTAQEFIRENKWKLSESAANTGLLYKDGEHFDIQNLPDGFTWDGDINLNEAKWLKRLPDNFWVNGYLDLQGCTGLTSLPENLSTGGFLCVRKASGIKLWPESISVGGFFIFDSCTGITFLPKEITANGVNWNYQEFDDIETFRAAFEKKHPPEKHSPRKPPSAPSLQM